MIVYGKLYVDGREHRPRQLCFSARSRIATHST